MDTRLQLLPARFRQPDVTIIQGQAFTGSPKVAGLDNAAYVPLPAPGPVVHLDCSFDAAGASEAVKLPLKFWHAFIDCQGTGGLEDVIDICRGGHLWFIRFAFTRGRARRDVTCKGGAFDVHFIDCTGLRLICAGDYTKYDARAVWPDGRSVQAGPFRFARPATRLLTINGCGVPVVECRHATDPEGACAIKSPLRPWCSLYFWFRATFFKEALPAPEAEFTLLPEELLGA